MLVQVYQSSSRSTFAIHKQKQRLSLHYFQIVIHSVYFGRIISKEKWQMQHQQPQQSHQRKRQQLNQRNHRLIQNIVRWQPRLFKSALKERGGSSRLGRDSSAVRRLFVRLAGAVGRQSALHKENSGIAAPTLGRHISTFRVIENKPNQPNSANIYQTFYQRESYKSNIRFSINKKMTGAFSLVFFLNYTALY